MLPSLTKTGPGRSPGFAAYFAQETSCLETTTVKSFEVSSLSCSNSGNSASARALNKRATTSAKRRLLRVADPGIIAQDLYREARDNSTIMKRRA